MSLNADHGDSQTKADEQTDKTVLERIQVQSKLNGINAVCVGTQPFLLIISLNEKHTNSQN